MATAQTTINKKAATTKQPSPFMEVLSSLKTNKKETPEKVNAVYDTFIAGKLYACTPEGIEIANMANTLYNLPQHLQKECHYQFLHSLVKKGNYNQWANFVKAAETKPDESEEAKRHILINHFKCSNKELDEIIQVLPHDIINSIVDSYQTHIEKESV